MKPCFLSTASLSFALASALAALFTAPSAQAAALTWTGGDGEWLTGFPGRWSAAWNNATLDTGTFNGAGGIVTVGSGITTGAAGVTFNNTTGTYTLQSNDATVRLITLGTNGVTLGSGATATIGSNVTLSRIVNNNGLTFVDGITQATSTLNIDSGGKLAASGNGNVITTKEATANVNTGGIMEGPTSMVVGTTEDGATLNVLGGMVNIAGTVSNLVLGNGAGITSAVNLKITSGSIDFTAVSNTAAAIRVGNTTGSTTGIIDLEGGIVTVGRIFENTGTHSSTLNLHGGTIKAFGNIQTAQAADFIAVDNVWVKSGGVTFDTNGKAITVAKDMLTDVSSTGGGLILNNTALTKGTLTLTGANTYSGNTTVTAGNLTLSNANTGNDASTVTIATTGATLNLTYTGTDLVDKLFFGTAQQPLGVYSATSVPAGATITTASFLGNGTLTVASSPSGSPYDSWATAKGLIGLPGSSTDLAKAADPDSDGKNNMQEFALDGNPLSGANDGKVATASGSQVMTLTLPVRTGAVFTDSSGDELSALIDGIVYRIEGDVSLSTFSDNITEVTGEDATTIQTGLPSLSLLPAQGWAYRTFRAPGTVTTEPKAFLRAKVSETP